MRPTLPSTASRSGARRLGRQQAMDAAFRLLARRGRSEAEIAAALEARGASKRVVGRALATLRRLGYVGDERFAAQSAERWRERGFGSLRIRHELLKAGVDDELARRAAGDARGERALAAELLARRFDEAALADPRGKARAARFLAGRGFTNEIIDSLLDVWD
jgi:regulatory protein